MATGARILRESEAPQNEEFQQVISLARENPPPFMGRDESAVPCLGRRKGEPASCGISLDLCCSL